MSRRPEHFENTAAASGAPSRPVLAVPVPPALRSAACDLRGRNVAVRLDVGGVEAVAVVSGPGDPLQWWAAIWDMIWPAAVIDVSDVTLPPGLNAVAWRDLDDDLNLYVPDALPPSRQRAAARKAMQAFRGRGWRTLLPASSAALLGAPDTGQFRQTSTPRAHVATWATVSAVLVVGAAAVYLAFAPQHHDRSAPGARSPAPGRTRTAVPVAQHRVSHRPGSRAAARPPRATPRAVTSGVQRRRAASPPARPSPGRRRTPGSGSTPGSQPTPVPSASPSGGQCVVVLGIRVCVP
jgi:hypothetical protein